MFGVSYFWFVEDNSMKYKYYSDHQKKYGSVNNRKVKTIGGYDLHDNFEKTSVYYCWDMTY